MVMGTRSMPVDLWGFFTPRKYLKLIILMPRWTPSSRFFSELWHLAVEMSLLLEPHFNRAIVIWSVGFFREDR